MREISNGWTKDEVQLLVDEYPKVGSKKLSKLIKRSPKAIYSMSRRLGVSFMKDNHICAMIIEEFVSNPNLNSKDLCLRYKIPYHLYLKFIKKWFGYKGSDTIILVLDSKV